MASGKEQALRYYEQVVYPAIFHCDACHRDIDKCGPREVLNGTPAAEVMVIGDVSAPGQTGSLLGTGFDNVLADPALSLYIPPRFGPLASTFKALAGIESRFRPAGVMAVWAALESRIDPSRTKDVVIFHKTGNPLVEQAMTVALGDVVAGKPALSRHLGLAASVIRELHLREFEESTERFGDEESAAFPPHDNMVTAAELLLLRRSAHNLRQGLARLYPGKHLKVEAWQFDARHGMILRENTASGLMEPLTRQPVRTDLLNGSLPTDCATGVKTFEGELGEAPELRKTGKVWTPVQIVPKLQ